MVSKARATTFALSATVVFAMGGCGGSGGGGGNSSDSGTASSWTVAADDRNATWRVYQGQGSNRGITIQSLESEASSSGVRAVGADTSNFTFEVTEGPAGLSVNDSGELQFDPSQGASAGTHSYVVTISGPGGDQTVEGTLEVMESEVIASGTIGPSGGRLTSPNGQVTLDIPEGAVDTQTQFEIIRGVQDDGQYAYRTTATPSLSIDDWSNVPTLSTPDPAVRENELRLQDGASSSGIRRSPAASTAPESPVTVRNIH